MSFRLETLWNWEARGHQQVIASANAVAKSYRETGVVLQSVINKQKDSTRSLLAARRAQHYIRMQYRIYNAELIEHMRLINSVAQVGRTLLYIQNSLNIAGIRYADSTRRLNEAQEDAAELQMLYTQYSRDLGDTSVIALEMSNKLGDAKRREADATRDVVRAQNANRIMMVGVTLSALQLIPQLHMIYMRLRIIKDMGGWGAALMSGGVTLPSVAALTGGLGAAPVVAGAAMMAAGAYTYATGPETMARVSKRGEVPEVGDVQAMRGMGMQDPEILKFMWESQRLTTTMTGMERYTQDLLSVQQGQKSVMDATRLDIQELHSLIDPVTTTAENTGGLTEILSGLSDAISSFFNFGKGKKGDGLPPPGVDGIITGTRGGSDIGAGFGEDVGGGAYTPGVSGGGGGIGGPGGEIAAFGRQSPGNLQIVQRFGDIYGIDNIRNATEEAKRVLADLAARSYP